MMKSKFSKMNLKSFLILFCSIYIAVLEIELRALSLLYH
jgi:hypothetical protein